MSEKRYFAAMLFLPLVLPFSIFVIGENLITGILFLSLGFAGIPYLIFALLILLWIRNRDLKSVRTLSYISPLLFIPVQAVYLGVRFVMDKLSTPELGGVGGSIFVSAVYIVIVGYAYVLLVNGGYMGLLKANVFKKE
ncbi:MAG TPA: hypothetical protein EYP40_07140 [Chromatiales bacterium]|nr:hypothetical protein [Chromatiales bacterium]